MVITFINGEILSISKTDEIAIQKIASNSLERKWFKTDIEHIYDLLIEYGNRDRFIEFYIKTSDNIKKLYAVNVRNILRILR